MTVVTVATSAPLVTLAHDWGSPVTRERTYPTTVHPRYDGTEHRQLRSTVATERITYRLLAPDADRAAILATLGDLADDRLIRVGRWEDLTRLTAAVSAGASTIACDTTDRPTFEAGAQVMLWRDPYTYEVAVIDTFTASTLDTVDPLTLSWGPGTTVVVVEPVRLIVPYSLTHWRPTSGALELSVERLVNDVAGLGSGGTVVTGTPAAMTLETGYIASLGLLRTARGWVKATVTDAAGNILTGTGIVWSSSDAVNLVVTPTADPGVVIVRNARPDSSLGASVNRTVTATLGAIVANEVIALNW